MTDEAAKLLLEKTARELGEHFEAVQILATWTPENGGTRSVKTGSGNWYARQGLAQEFVSEERARDNAVEIADKLSKHLSPPDEGNDWNKKA